MAKFQVGDQVKFTHYIESTKDWERKPCVIDKKGTVTQYLYKQAPQFPSHVKAPDEVMYVEDMNKTVWIVEPDDATRIFL